MKQKSVQDVDMLGHFGKTGIGYWPRTIFRQTYTRIGKPWWQRTRQWRLLMGGAVRLFLSGRQIKRRRSRSKSCNPSSFSRA